MLSCLTQIRQIFRELYRLEPTPDNRACWQFVILDEYSLVNYETPRMISLRLGEIFNNDEPFGGGAGICSRLRVGELTQEDITTLNSRLLDPQNPNIDTKRFENCTLTLKKMLSSTISLRQSS